MTDVSVSVELFVPLQATTTAERTQILISDVNNLKLIFMLEIVH